MHFSIYIIISLITFQISASTNAFNFSSLSTGQAQSAIEQVITIDHQCHYPFNPSSIIPVIIFQKKGIDYIAQGEKNALGTSPRKLKLPYAILLFYQAISKKSYWDVEEAKKRKNLSREPHQATYNTFHFDFAHLKPLNSSFPVGPTLYLLHIFLQHQQGL